MSYDLEHPLGKLGSPAPAVTPPKVLYTHGLIQVGEVRGRKEALYTVYLYSNYTHMQSLATAQQ